MNTQLRDYVDADYGFVRELFSIYLDEERARVGTLGIPSNFADTYLPGLVRKVREESGLFLVAMRGESRCGFVAVLRKDAAAWDRTQGEVAMVMELHVATPFRRHGVGRRLFEAAEAHFRSKGIEWVTLGTFANNAVAHAFYRSMGYAPTYQFMGKALTTGTKRERSPG